MEDKPVELATELFRVSVKALVRSGDRIVMLLKPDGRWDLPGGRLQEGEEVTDGLERELLEELGVSGSIGSVVYTGVRRREPPKQNVVVIAHLCELESSVDDITLCDEHLQVRLVAREEIDGLDMVRSYREAVKQAFAHLTASSG